jgi:hypothetical protein
LKRFFLRFSYGNNGRISFVFDQGGGVGRVEGEEAFEGRGLGGRGEERGGYFARVGEGGRERGERGLGTGRVEEGFPALALGLEAGDGQIEIPGTGPRARGGEGGEGGRTVLFAFPNLQSLPDLQSSSDLVSGAVVSGLPPPVENKSASEPGLAMDNPSLLTLLNQSDSSDRAEKSFRSCCCISRAAFRQPLALSQPRFSPYLPTLRGYRPTQTKASLPAPLPHTMSGAASCAVAQGARSRCACKTRSYRPRRAVGLALG